LGGFKPFALAGLWEQWWGADHEATEPLASCAIITTDANSLAVKFQNRMPALLDEHDYDAWLDSKDQDGESLRYLLEPFPVNRMSVRPVSTYMNNVRH
jgi:putative SOS response-associated peptidase YedK